MLGHLSQTECDELLLCNAVGRIGCSHGGKTYVVPVSYVFENGYIVCHSKEGMKIDMMRKNPSVCFQVDEMDNFTNWRSVIAQGRYEEVTAEPERYQCMKKLVDRMMKLKVSTTAHPPHLSDSRVHPHPGNIQAIVFKIHLLEITGRFEKDR